MFLDDGEPIVRSLLWTDFYEFTMGQMIWLDPMLRDADITLALKVRTKVSMAKLVNEKDLRRELDYAMTLRFNHSDIFYLRGIDVYQDRMFSDAYLNSLRSLQLPQYRLRRVHDDYELHFKGSWHPTTYWEIPGMLIPNALYFRAMIKNKSKFERESYIGNGIQRLVAKIDFLKKNPDITFCDFGTRRTAHPLWHGYIVPTLAAELSPNQFRGTSNVFLAREHGLVPMGTNSHKPQMILAGLIAKDRHGLINSQQYLLHRWWELYGHGLSIVLPDTYGTNFLLNIFTRNQAMEWKGFRHDSGDPFEFGEKIIKFYRKHHIEPKHKLLIFSDGLDLEMMKRIVDYFRGRIQVTFGWGTNLTNDLGVPAISLVVKPIKVNGRGLVKLSDNPAKTFGTPEDIEKYKLWADYENATWQECRY